MKNALLVIDVQEGFITQSLKKLPAKIKDFIGSHRFDYVLFTKFLNKEGSNWTEVLKWDGMLNSKDAQISAELKQFTTENNVYIKRASFSAFDNKDFQLFLKKNGVKELFICGLDTHACVLMSAMDAFALGYKVKVISDLCGSSHGEKYHKMAIEILKSNLSKHIAINSVNFVNNLKKSSKAE